jgi:glutathione-independent formaldehyde dehydrogenase
MKAVVWKGERQVTVEEVEAPKIEDSRDVIVRMTSSALCGTDIHIYDGRMPQATPGMVLGHEPLGVVVERGADVKYVQMGDRVVMPTHIFCGICYNCARGFTAACLLTNPGKTGAAYGYPGMGGYRGAQAELLLVPFADVNCVRLPGKPHDEHEDDYVLLADAWVTGWHATELAQVHGTRSVAVFGAGTIGLLSAYSAQLRGASEIYVVDAVEARLELARKMGFIAVDYSKQDPIQAIKQHRKEHMMHFDAGWEQMSGVDCGIDAVGFQAHDRYDPQRENPAQVIQDLVELINPTGSLGVIGVYIDQDKHPATDDLRSGHMKAPFGTLFKKGINVGFGRTHDRRYTEPLAKMIAARRARPSQIVTHHLPLEAAPEAYRTFEQREKGYIKVVFQFK